MRKNEDGYVLLYVLVVLVLLSLTAAAVCSIALHNLQAQRSSVEQMQKRYAAEGLGEQFVAKLQAVERNSTGLAHGMRLSRRQRLHLKTARRMRMQTSQA